MTGGKHRRAQLPRRLVPAVALAVALVVIAAPLSRAPEAAKPFFVVAIGGTPTITGGLNASVTGSTTQGQRLQISINFGVVSPHNRNRLAVVRVPVELRSAASYELVATVSSSAGPDPYAVVLSDVGFGLDNLRRLGKFATFCGMSSTIASPFNNDPSANVNLSARASYPSSLADVGLSRTIISGPMLSTKNANNKHSAYAVDAIFAIAPQFYSVSTFSATLTLTMRAGPPRPCSG